MIRNALRMSALGVASLLVASPAFAQLAPPELPAPAMPEAPISEVPSTTLPALPGPMALAPKTADDMTGSIGFGVGVANSTQLVGTTGVVAIKYWSSDTFALVPSLNFSFVKAKNVDATWGFAPEMILLFAPYKSTSTRFEIGGGLGFDISQQPAPVAPATGSGDARVDIYLPIQAGVEHFFTRWFSMGIAARCRLFDFAMQGDATQTVSFAINSTSLMGSLFFYTD